jgi:hypothetical protein
VSEYPDLVLWVVGQADAMVEAGIATPEQRTAYLDSLQRQVQEEQARRREAARQWDQWKRDRPWYQRFFSID